MTSLWQALDANQQLVLVCGLTLFAGLCLGAAWTSWLIHHVPQTVTDDPQQEYADATHADDVYDQEAEPDRAVAALRAELADDVAVGRWLG